jgi:hypothetical protein
MVRLCRQCKQSLHCKLCLHCTSLSNIRLGSLRKIPVSFRRAQDILSHCAIKMISVMQGQPRMFAQPGPPWQIDSCRLDCTWNNTKSVDAEKPREFSRSFSVQQLARHEILYPDPSVAPCKDFGRIACFPDASSGLTFRAPLFQAVCTRLADGLVRFRVVSAAPILICSGNTVWLFGSPSFRQYVPGKRFRLPSP